VPHGQSPTAPGASGSPGASGGTKKDGNGRKNNGGQLGFEAELFLAADKLRGNLEPSEYKHVALGLIFLKYISDAFEALHARLEADEFADAEDPDQYLAERVFWVPKEARWSYLQASAKLPTIGKLIDDAMAAIEAKNPNLKGVLPKEHGRPALNTLMIGELIDLVSKIGMKEEADRSKDILGRVYEYFLSQFAGAEGKRGGEFYTPRSVVRLLVEMLEPYKGRVYDPCCGSGGMFVQSEKFVEEHGGRVGDLSIWGQESNYTTWRLCRMNLAVRGIDSDIRWNNEGSFHKDEFRDLKADFILANPPFNVSDWGGDRLSEDARWAYGTPPAGNANFAWLQHILHHLSPAGVVLANGSMSSSQSGEGEIRRAMVEGDVVDCMIALPGQLFYSTQIPVCLWFLARDKKNHKFRERRGEVLFIDARKLGHMIDRTRKEFSEADIARMTGAYHAWRGEKDAIEELGVYEDVAGFCKSAALEEIRAHVYVLTPGRFVGAAGVDEEDMPFEERFEALKNILDEQFRVASDLNQAIHNGLRVIGHVE